ncbi:ACP phosphodiesterase [Lishizhenia sp.]|uniref:acyl carrier protein phosphodiesterase n=1 Tax=Lishizhenia sp. TaxID=2497594 RepID=UPI00299E5638|nr:ACP phosphodiesterase [Lishizhenia sp.]MDX1445879.1 ACP phosphodiesterase [Lishizhenia sp.]
MNFLGHLYFSGNDTELMVANLYGDYVKGNKLHLLPPKIQEGVRLHRSIDNFIDTNPGVKELFHHLYPLLPKIAGIAVDLYFDHLLAKNWKKYHPQDFKDFVNAFYQQTNHLVYEYSPSFLIMLDYMKKGDWLYNYKNIEGLDSAARGLSRRISFPNDLFKAKEVFIENETLITTHFNSYMQEAVDNFYCPGSQKLRNFNLK